MVGAGAGVGTATGRPAAGVETAMGGPAAGVGTAMGGPAAGDGTAMVGADMSAAPFRSGGLGDAHGGY
jgi:hypothetical protein